MHLKSKWVNMKSFIIKLLKRLVLMLVIELVT